MSKPPNSEKDNAKPLCFVIGPIGKDGTIERKHADLLLNSVIKDVLSRDEFKYRVKRADEDADPGMIGERVVSDIINADLVVADLTDLNPNAFYELGIRHSNEKPTIHIARLGTPLPFDNVSHRTVFVDLTDWQSIESARARLAESARTVREPGYRVSNPITQANASFKMRQSEDPQDRIVATIQERLSTIEAVVSKTAGFGSSEGNSNADPDLEAFTRYRDYIGIMLRAGQHPSEVVQSVKNIAKVRGETISSLEISEDGSFSIRFNDRTFHSVARVINPRQVLSPGEIEMN